ncbi:MAG: serine/threonine protein kinase [Myxococcales bacterium]|nr:serine/threonine protein kinase [Myxococcales bacterium]
MASPQPAASPEEPETRTALVVYNGTMGQTLDEQDAEQRRIGDFLVRRLIGEGGMGKVYEAEERLSRRRVALKVLRSELARSEAGRRAFVNEMGILASLDDPHVVRCLHCTEVDDQLIMVLEFLEGRTLRDHMSARGPLPWDETVAVAWQVASALAAAHGAEPPIIHRDLKPENVMLLGRDDEGESQSLPVVKVMDFGIAKVIQAASGHTTHSVGTLQYMSPEQIDALPLTPRADLYALGLLMWEMLAGHPPFESESPRLLLDKLCNEPTPALPDAARRGLPRGVEQLVMQLLEKAPEARPTGAAEVLSRLDPFRPAELARAESRTAPAAEKAPSETPEKAEPGAVGESMTLDDSAAMELQALYDAAERLHGKDGKDGRKPTGSAELRPQAKAPVRHDTVALVERAAGPRELSPRTAAAVIVGLSALAGLITYLIRLFA